MRSGRWSASVYSASRWAQPVLRLANPDPGEDLNNHDHLHHDPVMAVLAGKLKPVRQQKCAPVAGKSTLNRLELSRPEPSRYKKISYRAAAIEVLFCRLAGRKRGNA